ncbi:MAG: acetate--CoA ligase family protein [Gammaproteobacteria bacterium]|nr:acetate--CoA ligase family protein [Gammaproteobacteria bacterium]MCY4218576.1 acetate--CoA ligase family protein [Gammaproteobacteria bacterium]MCY4275715.1 acetate--CoA ligase family protein [Gammaproteobacteria bacterium]
MQIDRDRLHRFLNPKSIAVVGGDESERVLGQCAKLAYQGILWAVNPNRTELAGIPCVKHINKLPIVPDAVFLGISADQSIEFVGLLEVMGVGGVVCLASGFKEIGELGEDRQERLVQLAGSMPVLGPNCYGYINALTGAVLFPDQHGLYRVDQGVAIITASGNLGINFTLQQRNLPIAWLITVGNQAVMGIEDALEVALECANIRAIGLHIEGLRDVSRFIQLTELAREKGVVIIVLKVGKSKIGSKITQSHTAVLAGESRLFLALFKRLGVGQTDTVEEFLEALKLAYVHGPIEGNRLVSMSCSGGEASLLADLAVSRNLQFPEFTKKHKSLLRKILTGYVSLSNPLDYHTFIWGDYDRTYRMFSAMMKGDFDLFILIIDFPDPEYCDDSAWIGTIQAYVKACQEHLVKGVVVSSIPENITRKVGKYLINNQIVPLQGMSQALAAIESLSQVGMTWKSTIHPPKLSFFGLSASAEYMQCLDDHTSKQLLANCQIPVPPGERVQSVSEALKTIKKIGFPIAIKALDSNLEHKSEVGGVRIGLRETERTINEVRRMLERWKSLRLEKMIDDHVAELMVSISHDPQFGHFLMISAGGTLVEMINDNQLLLLPVDDEQILEALQSLKIWPLLNGYRGRKCADLEELVNTIKQVVGIMRKFGKNIYEIEINPLIIGETGAVVVDALIRTNKMDRIHG